MTFGEKLRYYRNKLNLTQAEFAKSVNLGTNTIINYENGKTYPRSKETYAILAKGLGVTEDALKDDAIKIMSIQGGGLGTPVVPALDDLSAEELLAIALKPKEDKRNRVTVSRHHVLSPRGLSGGGFKSKPRTKNIASSTQLLALRMASLFAGSEISDEDKDEAMRILNEAYWKSKVNRNPD